MAHLYQVEDVRSDSEDSAAVDEPDTDPETTENQPEMNGYINGKPAS